ncbi:SusC/RagA family TonB-linked outer membrane protein [uncultured Muribaculum sp.]|uniref:SusC/RagA family TonB-linked outer membrane protein n=1 Tax=uncultured Muribaculum sp. TaxID=1918613 RepID=UPI003448206A
MFAVFVLCSSAMAQQRVTVNLDQSSLKSLFDAIEKQTTYRFSYIHGVLENEPPVTIHQSDAPVDRVLDKALKDTGLTYKIMSDKQILVSRRAQGNAQRITVSGTVYESEGEPAIGASVMVKGAKTGTSTNIDGQFTLPGVPSDAVIIISYIGTKPQEILASDKARLAKVVLSNDSEVLDEVVVVGYGTQSSKLVTTSISKVKLDDIDTGNDHNPIKMLQGRVPGVNISNASGTPGANPNIQVRGIGSINGGSKPLYVVDGIPAESYPNINPSDIESIEVLKDASAAAIYGSRANSGVVIITTKNGKSGDTKIDVSGRVGFGKLAKDIEMANATEYANAMQAAIDNYNVQMGQNVQFYRPAVIEETDWVKLITRETTETATGSVSISGGNDMTNFYASFGANRQEGFIKTSAFRQYNLRTKVSHKISRIFKLNINLAGAASQYNQVEERSTSLKVLRTAREEQPWYGPFNEDGTYKKMGTEIARHNPVMLINEEKWTLKKYHLSGIFNLEVTPFKGFKWTPQASLYAILDNTTKKLTERHDARKNNSGWGALTEQRDHSFRYVIDNVFSYNNSADKLIYSVMAGHSFERYTYEKFGARSDNYANGAYPSSSFDLINLSTNIFPGDIGYTGYTLESYFGRVALNWDNRYILNASLRCDGSSRFSKGSRYGYFPSVSLAWRASEEAFFPKDAVVNDAKLRLSWGKTGSMAGVGNFAAMSLIGAGGASYNESAGFLISQDARSLTWEKANQYNAGVDIELWNNRLSFTGDVFLQRTTDLLYSKPVNASTGYTSIASNIGTLENRGLELSLTGKIFTGDFKWTLSGNISFVKNKLVKLIDGSDIILMGAANDKVGGSMHALIIGQPLSTYYMLRMDGIYQRDDEVPAKLYAKGVRAGDVRYFDYNGDGDISEADRMNVGKASPDWYGGITSTCSWRGFDLNIFGQFSYGGKIMAGWRGVGSEGLEHMGSAFSSMKVYDSAEPVVQFGNISKAAATTYWRGEGTSNTMPRMIYGNGVHQGYTNGNGYNGQTSTRFLEDGSYFKIKSVTLGYTLPRNLLRRVNIDNLRVYMTVDNLLCFTKYSGYDPEASYTDDPSSTGYGSDFGLQPIMRTFIWGLNLTF